jgi:hypothetical protein
MQEASTRRYALAQQIAAYFRANPNVAAVLLEGTVARPDADYSSDLDQGVFWTKPPLAWERRTPVQQIRATGLAAFFLSQYGRLLARGIRSGRSRHRRATDDGHIL